VKAPPQVAKGHRPQVFDDPAVDQLYAAYVTLATELSVAFDRIAVLERTLEQHAGVSRAMIEQAALAEQESPERAARRAELAARLVRPFRDFREAHIAAASAADAEHNQSAGRDAASPSPSP